jgi:hypothetical protein
MELQAYDVYEWWNLIQDLLQKYIRGLFDEHKIDEASYRRRVDAWHGGSKVANAPFHTSS